MHRIGATIRDSSKTITGTHSLQSTLVDFSKFRMIYQLNVIHTKDENWSLEVN